MTIKYIRDILKHYEDKQYDDWEIRLFDYNNQREIEFPEGMHGASKEAKAITFPIKIEPVDGEEIDARIRRLMEEFKK